MRLYDVNEVILEDMGKINETQEQQNIAKLEPCVKVQQLV